MYITNTFSTRRKKMKKLKLSSVVKSLAVSILLILALTGSVSSKSEQRLLSEEDDIFTEFAQNSTELLGGDPP